jgi:hypothetical protein
MVNQERPMASIPFIQTSESLAALRRKE